VFRSPLWNRTPVIKTYSAVMNLTPNSTLFRSGQLGLPGH
jgi:hypothetical protein